MDEPTRNIRIVRVLYSDSKGMSRTKIVMVTAPDDSLPPAPERILLVKRIRSVEPEAREIHSIMENPVLNIAVNALFDRLDERSQETDWKVMAVVAASWDLRAVRPMAFSRPTSQRGELAQTDEFFFS